MKYEAETERTETNQWRDWLDLNVPEKDWRSDSYVCFIGFQPVKQKTCSLYQLPGNNCFRKQGRAGRREDAGLNHSVFWCENNCFARLIQFLNKADKKYPPAQPGPARSQELICRLTCLAFLVAVWLMVFSYNYCPLITNKNQSRYSLEIISMEFSIGPQVQLNETDFIS